METCRYTAVIMPRKRAPKSVHHGSQVEPPRERLARLRKERGWTQVELAERVGITQRLVSDYERGRLRLNADIVVRLANALEIATDELLQPTATQTPLRRKPSLRVLRRLERIERLPLHQQNTLLKTIDGFLKGVAG
jgi:transcriptional regulator with XRE-family HTH domain